MPAAATAPAAPDPTAGEPVIATDQLVKRYGDLVAVDHLDLEVSQGEIYGLLGPNGAGKTTTILLLLGLSTADGGTARVLGLDPARDALAIKRRVGYLPDSVGFYESMTGRENLRYVARLNGIPADLAEPRIGEVLEEVGLARAADAAAGTYSRGMRQRLGIADALVKDPDILILDEPTIAIDPEGVDEILALIRRLRDEQGVTVLLSSHLLYQVQSICDRVGIFVDGRLRADGPIDELARRAGGPVEIELRVAGDADLAQVAHGVEGVTTVRRDGQLHVVEADRDVTGELARRLVEAGTPPTHLQRRGGHLEEIYRRWFRDEDTGEEGGDERDDS